MFLFLPFFFLFLAYLLRIVCARIIPAHLFKGQHIQEQRGNVFALACCYRNLINKYVVRQLLWIIKPLKDYWEFY